MTLGRLPLLKYKKGLIGPEIATRKGTSKITDIIDDGINSPVKIVPLSLVGVFLSSWGEIFLP